MIELETPTGAAVYFVSLGCPKNLIDSQVMLGLLRKGQYRITQKPEEAEVIIVNTCSFIEASKEESIETILDLADWKHRGSCRVLVAAGCLPQRYAKELEKEMPEVDLFIGTGQYHRITEFLADRSKALQAGDPLPRRSWVDQPAFIHSEKDPRLLTGPRYSGYLKLSEGCNRRCAFCIIPKLRGEVRSRTTASLVQEARQMAEQGVRELNLVAQDLTEYGIDWKHRERLETLLPELCKVDGIDWIRLHYVYPDDFSDELVELIAREPKIVKYLDMPIQHTSDRVLKSMGRKLKKARLFDLIEKLRKAIPDLVLRTSMIVGFPGETDEDFEEMCRDLARLKLQHVGVFQYSREEGTRAAEMPGQVHPGTRRKRFRKLTALLEGQRLEYHRALVGRRFVSLIEGPSEESDLLIQARLSTQAEGIDGHVLINDFEDEGLARDLKPGDLVEVEITEAQPQDVIARGLRRL